MPFPVAASRRRDLRSQYFIRRVRLNDALAVLCTDIGARWRLRCPECIRAIAPHRVPVSAEISVWKIHVVPHRSLSLSPFPPLPTLPSGLSSSHRMQYPPNGVWNYPLRRACPSVTFNIGENRGILAGRMHNSRRLQFRMNRKFDEISRLLIKSDF